MIFGQKLSFGTVSCSPQSFQCDCSSESPSGQPFLLHECLKLIDHFHGGNFMLVLPSQLHMNYECSKANSSCCAAQLLLDNWAVVSNFQKKIFKLFRHLEQWSNKRQFVLDSFVLEMRMPEVVQRRRLAPKRGQMDR